MADYTRCLAGVLAGMGVEVSVLTSARVGGGSEDGFPVWPVVTHWGFSAWPRIEAGVRGAQICHLQYQAAAFNMSSAVYLLPFWLGRRLPSLRFIVTFHDLRPPYLFPKAGRLRPWANLALAKLSHSVVVTNAEDWTRLQGRVGRLHLIPIGSNILPHLPSGYSRQGWRVRYGNGEVIAYFGMMNPSKGVGTLMEAVARLRGEERPVKVVMVGEGVGASDSTNRAYRERILSLVAKLGLGGEVVWTGHLPPEEVSAHLVASDLCVLPYQDGASYRRGSLMAALAHGLAIVTTYGAPSGPLPPLVHGENCFLVPPEDAIALAQAIATLLNSRQLRERLAAGARATAGAFSWEGIARETVKLYQEVLG